MGFSHKQQLQSRGQYPVLRTDFQTSNCLRKELDVPSFFPFTLGIYSKDNTVSSENSNARGMAWTRDQVVNSTLCNWSVWFLVVIGNIHFGRAVFPKSSNFQHTSSSSKQKKMFLPFIFKENCATVLSENNVFVSLFWGQFKLRFL